MTTIDVLVQLEQDFVWHQLWNPLICFVQDSSHSLCVCYDHELWYLERVSRDELMKNEVFPICFCYLHLNQLNLFYLHHFCLSQHLFLDLRCVIPRRMLLQWLSCVYDDVYDVYDGDVYDVDNMPLD